MAATIAYGSLSSLMKCSTATSSTASGWLKSMSFRAQG